MELMRAAGEELSYGRAESAVSGVHPDEATQW